jgi:hypothetical protein
MVFQALRHVGRVAVDDQMLARLRQALSAEQLKDLVRDARYTTDWIGDVVRQIVHQGGDSANHG